jgi:hypothetical protein
VISWAPIVPVETDLSTIFVDPDLLNQTLSVSWTDSLAGAGFDIDVVVSSVPLPAGALLLLTAVGGLGAVRGRRSAKA